jgi:hypothetical protein
MGNGGRALIILNLCNSSCPGHFTSGESAPGGPPSLCGLPGEEKKLLTFLGIKLWFLRLEACVVMILTELSDLPQMTPLILVCLLCGGGMWITSHLLILYLCTHLYICESLRTRGVETMRSRTQLQSSYVSLILASYTFCTDLEFMKAKSAAYVWHTICKVHTALMLTVVRI